MVKPTFDRGPGARGSVGLVALATDRACEAELPVYLRDAEIGLYVSRVPISTYVDTAALRGLEVEIAKATDLLIPGTRLDVVALGCTSGAVAIGLPRLSKLVESVRPEAKVTSPVEAAVCALRTLGIDTISMLTPYVDDVNELMQSYFTEQGFRIESKGSFKLAGDPEMNRVSTECLFEAGLQIGGDNSQALFISCAGLRTKRVIHQLEQALGKPVITSIQALAWHCMRLVGVKDIIKDRGVLFRRY